MGNRNMETTVANLKHIIPARYQLRASEGFILYEITQSGDSTRAFEAIETAFDYGFILGARAYKAGKVRGGDLTPDLDNDEQTDDEIKEIVSMLEMLPVLDVYKIHNLLDDMTGATETETSVTERTAI